jgi:uncharacterized membrane protein
MDVTRSPHSLVIAAGYGLGAAAYSRLPEQTALIWAGRPMTAFLLPTAAAVTYSLLRRLCIRHPIEDTNIPDGLAAFDAVMLRFVLFLMAVHATVLAGLLGMLQGRPWSREIVPVLLGLTMVAVGNLLPQTRPNRAIGIRTTRTLSDRVKWMQMHRFVGYTLVVLGIVIVVAGIVVPPPLGPAMILAVAPAAAVGIPVLLFWFKRHADGIRS